MDVALERKRQIRVEERLELVPHRRVAWRAYLVLSAASLLSVSAVAMLLGTIAAKGFPGLVIHVIGWTTTCQIGLTAVFIDFYMTEKRLRWVADAEGVRILKPEKEEVFVAWDNVSWIIPREHRISMAIHDMDHPEKIYFIEPEVRDGLYNMYLVYKVFPMISEGEPAGHQTERVEPRGVIAYDPEAKEWDR
jgi:hypothetical protein